MSQVITQAVLPPQIRFTNWADEVEQEEFEERAALLVVAAPAPAPASVKCAPAPVLSFAAVVSTPIRVTKRNKNVKESVSPSSNYIATSQERSPPSKVSRKDAQQEVHNLVRCCVNGIPIHELDTRVQWTQKYHADLGPLRAFLDGLRSDFLIDATHVVRLMVSDDLFASLLGLEAGLLTQ